MKALKRLVIGSSASMLTEKQMKGLKGGDGDDGPWFCHCNYETGGQRADTCEDCYRICGNVYWYCDHMQAG